MADRPTSSIATGLTVLEELSVSGTAGVSQLARQLQLPKSTVQRMLLILKAAGWVRQYKDAQWSLTLRCAVVSQRAMVRTTVGDVVRPLVMELRDKIGETVRCFMIEGTNIVLKDVAESERAVRAIEENLPGSAPLHTTAIGKAILAAQPERLAELLRQPLVQVTPQTITDPDALRRDIEQARQQGWAEVREEMHLDVGGVAAAADLGSDFLIGIAIAFPLHRAGDDDMAAYGRLARVYADRASQLAGPRILGPIR